MNVNHRPRGLPIALTTGVLVALMVNLNGILSRHLSGGADLFFVHLSGLTGALLLLLLVPRFRKRSRPQGPRSRRILPVEPLFFTAGLLGILIVQLNNLCFEEGGVLLVLAGILAGQSLIAFFWELITAPAKPSPADLIRDMVLALIFLTGALILGLASGASPLIIFYSLVTGLALFIQGQMNARNQIVWGAGRGLLINFGPVVLVLGIYLLVTGQTPELRQAVTVSPLYLMGGGLLGVAVIGMTSWLFSGFSSFFVVMGIYTGQLAAALLLDLAGGWGISPAKAAGFLILAGGLFLRQRQEKKKLTR